MCVRNEGYEASLERNKIYAVLPDEDAEQDGDLRVIDESGEDYLFSADRFVAIEVPAAVRASLLKAAAGVSDGVSVSRMSPRAAVDFGGLAGEIEWTSRSLLRAESVNGLRPQLARRQVITSARRTGFESRPPRQSLTSLDFTGVSGH